MSYNKNNNCSELKHQMLPLKSTRRLMYCFKTVKWKNLTFILSIYINVNFLFVKVFQLINEGMKEYHLFCNPSWMNRLSNYLPIPINTLKKRQLDYHNITDKIYVPEIQTCIISILECHLPIERKIILQECSRESNLSEDNLHDFIFE